MRTGALGHVTLADGRTNGGVSESGGRRESGAAPEPSPHYEPCAVQRSPGKTAGESWSLRGSSEGRLSVIIIELLWNGGQGMHLEPIHIIIHMQHLFIYSYKLGDFFMHNKLILLRFWA